MSPARDVCLFPAFPDLGVVAHGGLPAVADDGGAEQGGVLQKLFQLILLIGQIVQQRCVRVPGVDESLQTHCGLDTGQLTPTHAVFFQVNCLKLNAPLFEPTLCLFGIEAFGLAKNLNVHDRTPSEKCYNTPIIAYRHDN